MHNFYFYNEISKFCMWHYDNAFNLFSINRCYFRNSKKASLFLSFKKKLEAHKLGFMWQKILVLFR